ncbi:MAG TPA: aldehyde dehydrogenase family protein [bacterium]|nr:aldehyde dehydrogenase family protein [bacterium]
MTLPLLKPQFTDLYINGAWTPAQSGKTFTDICPITAQPYCEVAEGDAADIDRAVKAAHDALHKGPWGTLSAAARGMLLWKLADELERRAERLINLETIDNGKPVFESKIDLHQAIGVFRYFAGWADKIEGATIPVAGPQFVYTRREPVGVVGAIIPWNFPILMCAWKLAPALACGNTLVLKPAEQTPLTALEVADAAEKAGFPPGVLNVVNGFGPTAGRALVDHPLVAKIAFTGSTEVGREIGARAAATLKRVSLELGGKSANIVFADADIEQAIRGALVGIFYGKGEVCAAGSRLIVSSKIHDQVLEGVIAKAARYAPGDPFNPKTRMGALVSETQMNRVLRYIDEGKMESAKLVTGGKRAEGFAGYFVEPTVFDEVTDDMAIAREEIFGPVLAVMRFDEEEEAAALANASPYGLAAAVYTRDIARAHRTAARLQAGTVWINCINLYDAAAPFGGYKSSGYGRDLGAAALEQYTELKTVWVGLE